jgi:hypothetical protein
MIRETTPRNSFSLVRKGDPSPEEKRGVLFILIDKVFEPFFPIFVRHLFRNHPFDHVGMITGTNLSTLIYDGSGFPVTRTFPVDPVAPANNLVLVPALSWRNSACAAWYR